MNVESENDNLVKVQCVELRSNSFWNGTFTSRPFISRPFVSIDVTAKEDFELSSGPGLLLGLRLRLWIGLWFESG